MAPIAFDTSSNDASLFHTGEHTNHATKETVKFFLSQEEQPQHVQQNQEPCQNSRESLQPEELLEVPQKENVQNQTFKVLEDHILDQCSPSQHTTQHEVPQQEDNKDNKERAMNINDIEETTDSHNLEEKLLRDNEDYEMVSRAVNVLKFQLQQVKEDICKLKSMKEKALKDPIQFVEDLRNGTNEKVPKRQFIFGAPTIDWSKYHTTPSKYKARIDPEVMKSSKERVNPSSSDRSRSGRESSPDIVEFVHQKAQELGFKVPQNAIKSTRSKKKRINQSSDDESTFTLPSEAYINAQGSTSLSLKRKQMPARTTSNKAQCLISNCSTRPNAITKNTNYSSNQINSIHTHTDQKNNLKKSATPTSLSKNTLTKDKKSGRTSKSDSSKLPPEKRPRRPRVSGIAYMEAQPPPTLYMPDDDDETVIKEVMLLMDKIGNEPKSHNCAGGAVHNGYCCDGCHMDPILGTRFLCMNCDESREVDLCEDCMIEGKFENEHHKKSHRFSAIVNPTSQRFDMDHVPEQVDEYSYLDATPAEQ